MAALAGEAELLALQGAAHQALPVVGGGVHRRAAAGDGDVDVDGEGFGGGGDRCLEETTKENGTRFLGIGGKIESGGLFYFARQRVWTKYPVSQLRLGS